MSLKVATKLVIDEAKKRGWSVSIISEVDNILEVAAPHKKPFLMRYTATELSTAIGFIIASNKSATYSFLAQKNLPVPESESYTTLERAHEFLALHKRLALKPANGAQGMGVTTNITTKTELEAALKIIQNMPDVPVLQRHIDGQEARFLVIDGRCEAVLLREPASVVGDGIHAVRDLIELENARPQRQLSGMTALKPIDLDQSIRFLGDAANTIPGKGKKVMVIDTSNISRGGSSTDITDAVCNDLKDIAVQAAEVLGLGVAGVDIMCGDIQHAKTTNQAFIVEVEENPGLRIHHFPNNGKPRNVTAALLDALYKHASSV